MNICVFGKYRSEVKGSYSHQNEDEEFITEDYSYVKEVSGSDVIKLLKLQLEDDNLIDFEAKDGVFTFGFFNPWNGEDSNCEIKFTEIVSEEN